MLANNGRVATKPWGLLWLFLVVLFVSSAHAKVTAQNTDAVTERKEDPQWLDAKTITQLPSDFNFAQQFTLQQAQVFRFQLRPQQAVNITVSQINADTEISVYDTANNTRIKVNKTLPVEPDLYANLPASIGLKESVLIDASVCKQCVLVISAADLIDKSGVFHVQVDDASKYPINKIRVLRSLTKVAQLWQQAAQNRLQREQFDDIALLLEKSNTMANQAKLPGLHAKGQYLFALVQHELANYDEQANVLKTLIDTLKTNKSMPFILGRALFDLGDVISYSANNADGALQYYQQAQHIAQAQNDWLLQALVLNSLAGFEQMHGRYTKAEMYLHEAIGLFEQYNSKRHLIIALTSLGWFEHRSGNSLKANQYYNEALVYAKQSENPDFEVDIYTKLAKVYRQLGDFDQAIMFIDKALAKSQHASYPSLDGWAKQEKGRIYMVSGQYSNAIIAFEQARNVYKRVKAVRDESNIDYFMGLIYLELEDYNKAKAFVNKSLAFDLNKGSDYDIASNYNKLALIALNTNNISEALALQTQANEYSRSVEDKSLLGKAFAQSAAIYAKNGDLTQAESFFVQSTALLLDAGDTAAQIRANYQYAIALSEVEEREKALQITEASLATLKDLGASMQRMDFKRSYLSLAQKTVSLYAHLHGKQNQKIPALLQSAAFRATTLNQTIAASYISPEIQNERQVLHNRLYDYALEIQGAESSAESSEMMTLLRQKAEDLYAIEASIYQQYNKDKAGQSLSFSANALAHIQQQLNSTDAILYFDLGRLSSHLWLIKHSSIVYYELPSSDLLNALNSTVFNALAENKLKRNSLVYESLDTLSSALLGQISEDQLSGISHLQIVADESLNLLPFSLLSLQRANEPLYQRFAITYSPSLQPSKNMQQPKVDRPQANKLLLLADPTMMATSAANASTNTAGFQFSELPYTAKEAKAIETASYGNTTLLLKDKANKQALLAMDLRQFDILHFATHGISNSQVPEISGLVLSNSQNQANLLMAPEIATLALQAQLVVLSGCETTYGKLISGEGFMGLSRAFFEAGAKKVVGSLWKVQDDATAYLMARFYEYLLQSNESPAKALQKAKRDTQNYRRKNGTRPWRNPYYWAGFILYENGITTHE